MEKLSKKEKDTIYRQLKFQYIKNKIMDGIILTGLIFFIFGIPFILGFLVSIKMAKYLY